MKKIHALAAGLLAAASLAAWADDPPVYAPELRPGAKRLCERCGTVELVRQVKRKGEGGTVGVVGGAVVGGLLGNQIGKGSGRAVATVAGAVAGGYAGNEVQKHANARSVWITHVRMKDGRVRTFEQASQPRWRPGSVVRVRANDTLGL